MILEEGTFDNERLSFVTGPDRGTPLLFLHGVLRKWQDFMPLIPALAPRTNVVALDHRGHGKSLPDLKANYLVADYAADAVEFVRQWIDEPAVIYGHSLGAMVALAAAAQVPAMVKALILEDPPFQTMGARIRDTAHHGYYSSIRELIAQRLGVPELASAMADIEVTDPAKGTSIRLGDLRDGTSLRFSARCLRTIDPRVLNPIVEDGWMDGYDLDALLPQVKCPTLLLQADMSAGGMLTDEDANKLENQLDECIRVRFEGAGHLLHWMETEVTLRLVRGFLESL